MNNSVTFFKPETLAEVWQVPQETIWKLIRAGKLKAIKLGRLYRIPLEAKLEYEERFLSHV